MSANKELDNKDLNDILESVLEDFEEEQKVAPAKPAETPASNNASSTTSTASASTSSNNNNSSAETYIEELRKMMEGLAHGDFNKTLEEMVKKFEEEGGIPDDTTAELDPDTEASLQKLVEEFQSNPEMQTFMEGMMEKLVSKDVLYEPIKEMRDQYPPWLEANKEKLSQEDREKYEKQLSYVNEICRIYEAEPNNVQKLIILIQQMQETGQPPSDIMKGLAPELDPSQLFQSDLNEKCSIM